MAANSNNAPLPQDGAEGTSAPAFAGGTPPVATIGGAFLTYSPAPFFGVGPMGNDDVGAHQDGGDQPLPAPGGAQR